MAAKIKRRDCNNIAIKLRAREIQQSYLGLNCRYSRTTSFWIKYPNRLCLPLRSLFGDDIHAARSSVFLGFTKDGQRLLSYSCNISTNQSTGFAPVYKYTLYWWNFNLNQPLTKYKSIRLFRDEEIQQQLKIILCESINDKYTVIVGQEMLSSSSSSDDCCRSYITIVATPPLHPCRLCNRNFDSSVRTISNLDSSDDDTYRHQNLNLLCLHHNYEIHFSYNLLSPYPPFLPSLNMVIDNCVIFNSGDGVRCLIFEVYPKAKLLTASSHNYKNFGRSSSPVGSNRIYDNLDQPNSNYDVKMNLTMNDHNNQHNKGDKSNIEDGATEYGNSNKCISDGIQNSDSKTVNNRFHKLTLLEIPNAVRRIRQVYYAMPDESNLEISASSSFDVENYFDLNIYNTKRQRLYLQPQDSELLEKDALITHQLALDIECCIGAIAELLPYLQEKELSLADYDLQIIDVCPFTMKLTILIVALFKGTQPPKRHHRKNWQSCCRLDCVLSWSLKTNKIWLTGDPKVSPIEFPALHQSQK
ncbi:uncharacterized protein TRIADDRAFT_58134 [Trichoplax adhaerens]|uniref:DDB1- and CUL4-associated factor 15 WD40 repeat-containing domain-containing protein n=1 Tax=Trichoplax adhaerens TaxID=10228 RepID=B3S0Y9_TRIAD|nr:predicted protein [Trichoplax adhaerens]EDV23475.1 predicted protein [Trichoplax adhaerens]|eukprot:XP_002114385.1 predicted protein [Trichoplax adhaerens]